MAKKVVKKKKDNKQKDDNETKMAKVVKKKKDKKQKDENETKVKKKKDNKKKEKKATKIAKKVAKKKKDKKQKDKNETKMAKKGGKKKKDNKKKDSKKDKKGKKEELTEAVMEEVLVATTDLEPEPEEVQFTDTSYTSASFESIPPAPDDSKLIKKKAAKKKKIGEAESSVIYTRLSSEILRWSEESLKPPYDHLLEKPKEPEPEKEKKEKKQKKKKDKKEKKKKKKTEDDIPDFKKPKTWKKMAKKERDAWLLQKIDDWRVEKEAEKQAKLAGVKERRIQLAKERAEMLEKEAGEQEVRRDMLEKAVQLFQSFESQKMQLEHEETQMAEWLQYLRCDGLPDPRIVTELNTFLHIWQQNETVDDNELDKKFIQVLPILEMLETFRLNNRQFTKTQAENYDEVRLGLRAQLAHAIQMASYTLLRDIEKNLTVESTKLATYQREFQGLRLDIWVAIKWPTRKIRPNEPEREPVELSFPSMKVTVKLPKTIDGSCVCVRAARSMIDLLSESSRSFALLFDMPNRYEDLFTFNVKELMECEGLLKAQDAARAKFYKDLGFKVRELEAFLKANAFAPTEKQKDELDNLNMTEPPYMPYPRDQIAYENEYNFQKYLKSCVCKSRIGELNLRKYRICGGVLNLDLIVTPPQPKRMQYEVTLTTLQLPKELEQLQYQVQYCAPEPPEPGVTRTPEEIEDEIKEMEAQYEKLAMVFIDLPQDVMWNEPPVIVQWQEDRNIWTTNFVNDYKFNEDKLTIQFRTGVLWPIGIATLKYSNMPYQAFDIKPDPGGKGVIVTVTGLCVTVTWICISNYVMLTSITNASTPALTEHFNKKYTVKKMVQLMRDAACDFFPDFDGHTHVEMSSRKEWVMERHTYHAMAFMSRAYNFQSSRWNQGAGFRTIIMQAREAVDTKRIGKLQLVSISPERLTMLKCVESTPEFSHEALKGLPYFPCLFTYNMIYGSVDARQKTLNMQYKLVETVFELLLEIKPCSYS